MLTTPSSFSFSRKAFTSRMILHRFAVLVAFSVVCIRKSQAFVVQNSREANLLGLVASGNEHDRSFRQARLGINACSNNCSSTGVNDSVRNFVAGILFSFALTISPPVKPTSHVHNWFVVNAEETQVTLRSTEQTADTGVAEDDSQQSLLTAPSTNTPDDGDTTVVEQVWTLVAKYFIDQTFNGQVCTTPCQ